MYRGNNFSSVFDKFKREYRLPQPVGLETIQLDEFKIFQRTLLFLLSRTQCIKVDILIYNTKA